MDPLAPFDQLIAVTAGHIVVPDTWQQGRGAFGGYVTAVMARALELDDRPLRSLTAELCGPLQPGDATVDVEVLRAGNAVTTSAVRIVQNGEVQAHGVGVLGRARVEDRDGIALDVPAMRPWRDVPAAPIAPPMGPAFAHHFEFRVTGALPFSGDARASVEGWVRPLRPGERRDAAYLAACIDAYWPAIFSRETAPRPMATIAFTFQPFVRALAGDRDAPLYYRARFVAADGGYCVEFRELWTETGRLAALNQQTFVIIK
jgi:hypothetical protein